ncbi:ABC transporter substrate-binding protein [Paenibacillus abyssi]|uniref:Sugar ABC transporter substrate-binding protein n=1 Tax=Paenibacillus abyssi TaxID=1340531 RepID=A0A917D1F3_9BACL|nr:extracellular solute-binding protein [Paenibacillus abyssi]GGG08343.1 sugar ABC transporter substrate-binding protein [Paenibacillus abyssi]
MKKWMSVWLSILIATAIVAGCSSGNGGSSNGNVSSNGGQQGAGEAAAENVTVSLWILNDHAWIDGAVEDFKQENPNINVEVSKYGVDPLKEALKVAANSKTLPNMWFTWGGSLGSFYAENGLTADLTQIAADHNWSEIYNQAAIDMSTYDGKVSGIPYHLNAVDMWYSKQVYEELNLSAPATFEEFEAQLQTIKDGGFIPLALGGKNGWHIMRLTEQLLEHFAGPELHDQLNSLSASWNDPAVVQTFEKIKEYTDKEYFPKGHVALDQAEAINTFYPGQAALTIEGTWLDRSINTGGFSTDDYNVFKFPTERVSVFAEMFQINGALDQAAMDATVKLGEYITSLEVVNKYIDTYGTPATLNVTFTDNTPHVKPLLDMATNGGFLITDQALPQEVVQKLFEAQDKVALGEWTPQQAAEEMDKAVNDYKSKNNG